MKTIPYLMRVFWAALLLLLPTATPQAQFQWPEKGKNLKVLPEDTTTEQLRSTMIGFATALGVRCVHCHTAEGETRQTISLSDIDFAADVNPNKEKARTMIRMVRQINADFISEVSDEEMGRNEVACVTCHRGVVEPRLLQDLLVATFDAQGAEAAIQEYRSLRTRYFGRFSYDFGEMTLLDVARQLAARDQEPAAFSFAELNLEFYPDSWQTLSVLGQLHLREGRKEKAIELLEKALEKSPDNAQLKQLLEQARKP